jgi:hypothetical protein
MLYFATRLTHTITLIYCTLLLFGCLSGVYHEKKRKKTLNYLPVCTWSYFGKHSQITSWVSGLVSSFIKTLFAKVFINTDFNMIIKRVARVRYHVSNIKKQKKELLLRIGFFYFWDIIHLLALIYICESTVVASMLPTCIFSRGTQWPSYQFHLIAAKERFSFIINECATWRVRLSKIHFPCFCMTLKNGLKTCTWFINQINLESIVLYCIF